MKLYPEQKAPFTKQTILNDLKSCGIKEDQTLIVHSSLRRIGYIIGGAEALVDALLESVGSKGTIVVPTQTWKNLDPKSGVHDVPKEWWSLIREHFPAFNPEVTPSVGMGAVAEIIRTYPGAKRSYHPVRSFAAVGLNANRITSTQKLEMPLGEDSPLAKIYDLDGYVLLLGVGHDKNTSLHLAESRANYASKEIITESSAMMIDGQRRWVSYDVVKSVSDDFKRLGEAFDKVRNVQTHYVGKALTRLIGQRFLVDFAVRWMELYR